MQKPKIAILTLHPHNYGGVLTSLKEVYKFCDKYFEPTVFFLGFDKDISAHLRPLKFDSQVRKKRYFGMDCVEVGSRFAFWEPGHYTNTLDYWKHQLDGYDYFFVTAGTCIPAHPLAILGKKYVMWTASSYDEDRKQRVDEMSPLRYVIDRVGRYFINKIEKLILNKAGYVFPLSSYAYHSLNEVAHLRSAQVVGHPISAKVESKQINNKNIVAIGRFDDPRKNVGMLLRVFEKLNHDSHLYVIGPKPSQDRLKGLSLKNVTFTGQVSFERLETILKESSLMLLTSYQEGLGIVGLEAMSYGLPVISTRCGGAEDYVIDGENGFLVDVNDDNDMISKAQLVLDSLPLHQKLSDNAIKFIVQNCSHDSIHGQFQEGLIKVYPELESVFFNQVSKDIHHERTHN